MKEINCCWASIFSFWHVKWWSLQYFWWSLQRKYKQRIQAKKLRETEWIRHANPYQTCSKKTQDLLDLQSLTWILHFCSLHELLQHHPIGSVIFWDDLCLTQKAAEMFTLLFTKLTSYDGKIHVQITVHTSFCLSFISLGYLQIWAQPQTRRVFCNTLVAQSSVWNCIISNGNGNKTDFTHMDSLTPTWSCPSSLVRVTSVTRRTRDTGYSSHHLSS